MLKRKQQKSLTHERFNSLFSKNKTYRPLFTDVESFDDLFARNTDVKIDDYKLESSSKIIKKPSKLTIIEPTFKNFLHQLTPEIKKLYNDIKNLLMSFENMNCHIEKYYEIIEINSNFQFVLRFVGPYIQIKFQNILFNIDASIKFKMLSDEIHLIMQQNKINKIENYQIVDYITQFPLLDNCIIMDEDIVGNLPFKEFKK